MQENEGGIYGAAMVPLCLTALMEGNESEHSGGKVFVS